MIKIYCEDCKYYKRLTEDGFDKCFGVEQKMHINESPIAKYRHEWVDGDCSSLNKNNDCKHFKLKFWQKWFK